nr:hypothetical protein [Tanacetum cinerariifolium]
MKGFAMWDWGHMVTWGVGGVNGTVQVRGSAQEKAVGVMGVLAGNSVGGTMATTIEQQVTMDEALVPSTQRLRIGRRNFRLPSDIQSKESTLQLVYNVLRRCPFFKMNNKKNIVNLESFRDMLHICPRIPGQSFDELPFEEAILHFIRFLGHNATIRTLTDVNINKLYQPWRSFAAIINKCLTGKSSGYDSFWLSQAQILDDFLFSTIKMVSRHQNTQQYGAMLPIELTNDEIRNIKAYKEYYAFATEEAAPKPKASAKRKRSDSDTSITPPTATATPKPTSGGSGTNEGTGSKPGVPDVPTDESEEELSLNSSNDEGEEDADEDKDGDERYDDEENQEVLKFDEQDDAEGGRDDEEEGKSDKEDDNEETRDEESFDPIPKTPESSEDEGDGEQYQGLNVNEEEHVEEEEEDKLYRDVNINQRRGLQATLEVEDSYVNLTSVKPDGMESIFTTASSSVAPLHTSTPIMTPSTIATITTISQAPIPLTPILSEVL